MSILGKRTLPNESIYTIYQKDTRNKVLFKRTIFNNDSILRDINIINNIIDMLVDYRDYNMIRYILNLDINDNIRTLIYKNIIYQMDHNDGPTRKYFDLLWFIIESNKDFDKKINPCMLIEELMKELHFGIIIKVLENYPNLDIPFSKILISDIKITSNKEAIDYIYEYM